MTVVEQAGTVGAACSYGNAGLVSPSHCIPLARPGLLRRVPRWLRRDGSVHIRPRVSRELITFGLGVARASRPAPLRRGIRTLRDHCRASRDLFDELTAAGLDLGYQKNGLMNVCSSAEGLRALVRDAELLEGEGFRPEILDPNQARAREPQLLETISGGVFWDEDGQCEPARYVQSMADTARAAGADFRFDSRVTSFSTDAGGSISAVETDQGTLRPRQVVLAAGARSAELGFWVGDRVGLQPGTGYHVHIPDPETRFRLPLIFQEHVLAVTPMSNGTRLAGTMDFIGFDYLGPERSWRLIGVAESYVRQFNAIDQATIWSGQRPCTPDSLPIIGRSRRASNLIYATGHGMLGITLAPITGLVVSEIAASSRPSVDLSTVSPLRFR